MNIVRQQTTVAETTQEILLRTLASDIASLEHGNTLPVAERMTTHFAAPEDTEVAKKSGSHAIFRIILTIVVLGVLGFGIYRFVYPYIVGGVTPTTI
jgi:hypothetical protein